MKEMKMNQNNSIYAYYRIGKVRREGCKIPSLYQLFESKIGSDLAMRILKEGSSIHDELIYVTKWIKKDLDTPSFTSDERRRQRYFEEAEKMMCIRNKYKRDAVMSGWHIDRTTDVYSYTVKRHKRRRMGKRH